MKNADRPRRPTTALVLLVLLVIQGLGGLAGGLSLTIAPDGSVMKMSTSLLDGSPFHDYLIPGLILLLVLGVLPLITAAGLWLRRRWSWYAAFVVGCALMIWILVEITIIPYSWLQPFFGGVGLLIFIFTLLRPVRRFYRVSLPGRDLTLAIADNTGSCRLAANKPMRPAGEASGSFRAQRRHQTTSVPHLRRRRPGPGAPRHGPARGRRRHRPRPGAEQ